MPELLKDRMIKVSVGKSGSLDGVGFSQSRVTFNVVKTSDKTPNSGEVVIYNLSRETREKISDLDNIIVIEAGYREADGLKTLFAGDLTEIGEPNIGEPDVGLKLVAGSGIDVQRKAIVSLSFKGKTSARSVLNQVISEYGKLNIDRGIITDDIPNRFYDNGFAFVGTINRVLNSVTKYLGLDWTVEDQSLKIVPAGSDDGTEAVFLSAETGMIGIPERIQLSKDKAKKSDAAPGWKVKSFLNPTVQPRGRIRLKSPIRNIDGIFRVDRVEHVGDNYGGDYMSTIECELIKNV